METMHRRHTYIIATWGIIALAALLALAVAVLPQAGFSDPTFLRSRTASALFVTIIMIGAAAMMLSALKRFKKGMRRAYVLVAIGFLLFGIGLIQLPVIGFFNGWDTLYVNSGLLIAPFILSAASIYLGMRRFAIVVSINSMLTSRFFVGCLAIIIGLLSFIAAQQWSTRLYIPGTDMYIAIAALSGWFTSAAAILAWRIVSRIGPFYLPAMRQLAITLTAVAIGGWHESISSYVYGNPDWYVASGVSLLPLAVGGLLLIRATYTLGTLNSQSVAEQPDDEDEASTQPAGDNEYTNAITYAAGLSSHPGDIDFILDDLRLVTSNLEDGQALSPEDKRRLINVYLKIELYLTYHDPIRNFNREEIRSKLSPALRAEIVKHMSKETAAANIKPATATPTA
jgi:hypothetical protein